MVKIFILTIQVFIISTLFAQEPAKKHPASVHSVSDTVLVKMQLEEVFRCVRANEVEKLASYLVYRGSDRSRAWQGVMHYTDETERKEVERVCQRIKDLLDKMGKFEYQQFHFDPSGPWYVWNLGYNSNGNSLSTAFAFKKIGKEFCLGDID